MKHSSNKFESHLRSPITHQPLRLVNGNLVSDLNESFSSDEGVWLFENSYKVDAVYEWGSELRDPRENMRLDQKESPMSKNESRERMENMIQYVVDHSSQFSGKVVVDIATGRGLLARKLALVHHKSLIFLSDISTNVLVGTNKLIEEIKHDNRFVPLQSTATNLPIKNQSIDLVVSFGPNNIQETSEAFSEIYRVLKPGGLVVASMSLIEEGSPSHNYLKQQQESVSPFSLINGWETIVKKIGLDIYNKKILFDGPVERIPLDVLPREDGERFQDLGFVLQKNS